MTHTPGPWHRNIKPGRKYPTIFAGRNTHIAVAKSDGLADDEVEANIDLIAAAPDLLEALEAMLQGRPTKEPPRDMVAAYRNWLAFEKARAALKLAKGE